MVISADDSFIVPVRLGLLGEFLDLDFPHFRFTLIKIFHISEAMIQTMSLPLLDIWKLPPLICGNWKGNDIISTGSSTHSNITCNGCNTPQRSLVVGPPSLYVAPGFTFEKSGILQVT